MPIVLLAHSAVYLEDDAYISYRYAWHLVAGDGLVFNTGERVEGYSNLLWTLMMTVPLAFSWSVESYALTLGVGLGLLAMLDVWRISRRMGLRASAGFAALLSLALLPGFWLALGNGLEAGLYSFLLTRIVYYTTVEPSPLGASITGTLLIAARPEGLAVVMLCALYVAGKATRSVTHVRRNWRHDVAMIAVWSAFALGMFTWRFWYYGAFVPNTITAKSPPLMDIHQLGSNLAHGAMYVAGFAASAPLLAIGAMHALLRFDARGRYVLLLAIPLSQVPLVLLNGGDWMRHHRLLMVHAPLLALCLALLVDSAIDARRTLSSPRTARLRYAASITVVLAVVYALQTHDWYRVPYLGVVGAGGSHGRAEPAVDACYHRLNVAIAPALLPGDVMSPEALGLISFTNPRLRVHDPLGLTDAVVARDGPVYARTFGRYHPEYTARVVAPTVILAHSGLSHLGLLARASGGTFNDTYASFTFPEDTLCQVDSFAVSIRRDAEDRFAPRLASLNARQVSVPGH